MFVTTTATQPSFGTGRLATPAALISTATPCAENRRIVADLFDCIKRFYNRKRIGQVTTVIRAASEADALRIANETRFGLGSSIWSKDIARAEQLAAHIQAGNTFINGMVKSDPRLPFGGVKASGYGRELSRLGMHEFVNAKTVWIR